MLTRGIANRCCSVLATGSLSSPVLPCSLRCPCEQLNRSFPKRVASATLKVPSPNFFIRRSWTIPQFYSSGRNLFTTRAMAQTAGSEVPLAVVYVTVPNKDLGKKLATDLVTNKLAACVNQVPGVISTYTWEGKIETDEEVLLIIKTRQASVKSVTKFVIENHPYSVPEVVALPILGGSAPYMRWVVENTSES